jgi:hypothetical protein
MNKKTTKKKVIKKQEKQKIIIDPDTTEYPKVGGSYPRAMMRHRENMIKKIK